MRRAKVPLDLLRLLQDKEILLGAIDVASDRVETPEEVAETILRRPLLRGPRVRIRLPPARSLLRT
jgi:methionine synthase II (cobalamin-independent)